MLYIIYGLIFLIIIVLYFLVEEKKEYLVKLGKVSIISGVIILSLGLITNVLLSTFLNNFNIIKISPLIFEKFIYHSSIIIVIGVVLLLTSKIINKRR